MKFKHFLTTAVVVLLLTGCKDKKEDKITGFIIAGKMQHINEGEALLLDRNPLDYSLDTIDISPIKNGKFQFKGKITSPRELIINIKTGSEKRISASVFAENSNIEVVLDTTNYSYKNQRYINLIPLVKGSSIHDEYETYQELAPEITAKMRTLNEEFEEINLEFIEKKKAGEDTKEIEGQLEKLRERLAELREDLNVEQIAYIDTHPNSPISAYALKNKIRNYDYKTNLKRYKSFSPEVQQGYYGKVVQKLLEKLKKGSPGAVAHLFQAQDINGDTLRLKDFRGKYVLLDFWASWCKPCRKGNPHLKKLYKKYHDQGFEIIGISDDDSNPEAWKNAVAEDGIGIWHHVLRGLKVDRSNGKYEILDQGISEYYDIHYLPTKILIDKNGIIIGRYGSEEKALDAKLKSIFGNQVALK